LGVGGWETPWGKNPDGAKNPDGVIEFTLPSGEDCEYRIENVDTTSRERSDELRAWPDDHTLDQVADIDATLKDMRAQENTSVRDDGTEVKVGYGTPFYDANNEYVDAVTRAVNTAIAEQAEETGILKGSSLGVENEVNADFGQRLRGVVAHGSHVEDGSQPSAQAIGRLGPAAGTCPGSRTRYGDGRAAAANEATSSLRWLLRGRLCGQPRHLTSGADHR
jgi:hypothetical protein